MMINEDHQDNFYFYGKLYYSPKAASSGEFFSQTFILYIA